MQYKKGREERERKKVFVVEEVYQKVVLMINEKCEGKF